MLWQTIMEKNAIKNIYIYTLAVYTCIQCIYIHIYIRIYIYTYIYKYIQSSQSIQSLSRVQLFATPWKQRARPPCPSPTPGVYSNSCPLSRWGHPIISSSVAPFSSRLHSFPASGSFPVSQLFPSGGRSTGVSAYWIHIYITYITESPYCTVEINTL